MTMNKKLTATESRVLQLIAEQKKSKEIAELLFVSEKTIRNHRYNIKKKLDLPKENNSLLKWAIINIK
ncbi:MAG: helix-turn-helix transcriptional regulator [Chitinophagaceae bacterium]|nr:helix-turn-helix transcriptional regulator [Chitinophagaceae bacterium]